MKIDRPSRQAAKKYFRACVRPDGSLDEGSVRELIQLLVTEKPRNYLGILSRLQQLVKIHIDERSVRVESASALPDRGAAIFAEMERRFGPASWNYYETNPALLGGLRVQRGNSIWDGSVWGRLARLETYFSQTTSPIR
jgi:F-type H+-transporting ATPase subunit delta